VAGVGTLGRDVGRELERQMRPLAGVELPGARRARARAAVPAISAAAAAPGAAGGTGGILWTGNLIVQGSVLTERELAETVRARLIESGRRSAGVARTSGGRGLFGGLAG
jgi:hypothetical protein